MIEFKNVEFAYSSELSLTLFDINLTIKKGEFVAVLGRNGCGKSTIAKHMNAILLPKGGNVYIDEMDSLDENLLWQIRQLVGMVFQNPDNQIVATVVEEDVAFGPENLSVPPPEIIERVERALKTVNMEEYRKSAPHMLSGGQKQRIAIAGVIAMMPSYIVLDEPTAMLDPKGRREVINTIKQLNKELGITIVLITHYMDEAAAADRVIVMDNGNIAIDDTPRAVFSNVALLKNFGLDVPQVTNLLFSLRRAGIYLRYNHITVEGALNELLTVLPKRQKLEK